jgi:hypothetical protein
VLRGLSSMRTVGEVAAHLQAGAEAGPGAGSAPVYSEP